MHNSPVNKPIIEEDFILVFYLALIDGMIGMVVNETVYSDWWRCGLCLNPAQQQKS
jgi:hypothetical protein